MLNKNLEGFLQFQLLFHREAPTAIPAAAQTFSASPGKNGRTAWFNTVNGAAWDKNPSQAAPIVSVNKLPAPATTKQREKLREPRRHQAETSGATTG